jgi:hypothetical protein
LAKGQVSGQDTTIAPGRLTAWVWRNNLHHIDADYDAEGGDMKAITVRNIPSELQGRLEKEASETHSSLNKTVLRLLLKATGISAPEKPVGRNHDLDHLAGTWTAEEAAQFDEVLADQRRIDAALWE